MSKHENNRDSQSLSVTRRGLLKAGAAMMTLPFIMSGQAGASETDVGIAAEAEGAVERIVQTCSTFDCGGKCDIRAHVADGVITQITTRPDSDLDSEMPIMRACVRGRSYRKFVYHPDRLKYPMKRVGKRGEGKFERISWDEATTIIADNLKRITAKYGPECRFVHNNTATSGGTFSGDKMMRRLLNLTGGYLEYYHSVSMGNTAAATPYTYGAVASGNSLDTLMDTKLVILWGHNPTETIFGHTNHYFQQMKQNGTRFIVVDPRYSDTVASLADEWIPLLPSTDNALMDAMMYVIISENMHDKAFIERHTLGFDESSMPEGVPANESLVAYLMGDKDGIVKTPEWAEKITHVPAQAIRQLARDYANTKPAALIQGWGPQRHNCGERTARGSTLLATITGNVGIKGGWAAGYGGCANRKFAAGPEMPENPVKENISIMNWVQAADDASKVTPDDGLKGADKLKSSIRVLFSLAGNYLANQNPDLHQAVKVLEDESKIEFIVVSDLYMTPSARYADILLPETCKDKHNLEMGRRFRRVYEVKGGGFIPTGQGGVTNNVYAYTLSISCNHCADPICTKNCPTTAMHKRPGDGIVRVDTNKCVGCGYCAWSCPYGAPQMNEEAGQMSKCDFCVDLQAKGEQPICVATCPLGAIKFGPIDELRAEYGNVCDVQGLPDSSITHPNLVIKPHQGAEKEEQQHA